MTLTIEKRKKYKFGLIISITISVGFFLMGFSNGIFISDSSLKIDKGTLKSYTFDNLDRGRYGYFINLNETNKNFQIVASLVDNFDADGFRQTVNKNDSLELAFLETPLLFFLNKNDLVYIKSNDRIFLTKEYSLNKLKSDSSLSKYISLIAVIIAVIIFILQRNDKYNAQRIE